MKKLAPVRSAEHEHEAQHGLPEPLPAGERMLWQGSPSWRLLARHAFHLRKLGLYFVALLAWAAAVPFAGRWFELASAETSGPAARALPLLVWYALLALVGLGLVALIARLAAQAAVYTITDKRVVMRIGIVLTMTFNLPYRQITRADLRLDGRRAASGTGDIALSLANGVRIPYLQLWPHARPWQVRQPQPMLRNLENADEVARLLGSAWSAATGVSVTATTGPTTPSSAPSTSPGTSADGLAGAH